MKMRARLYPLTSLLFLSCGGGGSDKPLTTDDFCAMKATTECQVVGRCAVVTMDACVSARRALCDQFVQSALVPPRVFTPGNVGGCISKTNAAYSKSTILPSDLQAMDVACNWVFQGNVAQGDNCTVDYDCAGATNGSVFCELKPGATAARCATHMSKNLNDLCGNRGETCNPGSYCADDNGDLRCLAKKQLGDACDPVTLPCIESLRCTGGTCMTRQGLQGACTTSDDCMASAPYCDKYAGNICDPGLTFATNSPSCVDYGGATGGGGSDAGTASDADTTSDGGGG